MDAATTHPHPPDEPRRLRKKKQPPPVAFHNSKANTLRRAPSAPTYPSFTSAGAGGQHHRSPTFEVGTSPSLTASGPAQPSSSSANSSSSLRHKSSTSPVYGHSSPHVAAAESQHSLTDKRPTPELVGQPFDAAAIYKNIHDTTTKHFPPRPPPPQHTHTAPVKSKSPRLRQSASFTALARTTMETITPPRSDGGSKSPRQRYSDEADAAQKNKNRKSDGGKKKGTFSSFMNSMLGSPRRPTISTPTNPMHVTHVSIDNQTGEFTVRDTLCPHAMHIPYPSLPLDTSKPYWQFTAPTTLPRPLVPCRHSSCSSSLSAQPAPSVGSCVSPQVALATGPLDDEPRAIVFPQFLFATVSYLVFLHFH
jgi:p21-activated kinase 1